MELSRRGFMGAGAALLATTGFADEGKMPAIQGLNEKGAAVDPSRAWQDYAEPGRKVRVGIAGEGVCSFGSAFGYQSHPLITRWGRLLLCWRCL